MNLIIAMVAGSSRRSWLRYVRLGFFVGMALPWMSCNKQNVSGFGSLEGLVRVRNEFGTKATDQSGVLITLSGPASYEAQSDSTGAYNFASVAEGSYRMDFSRNGMGSAFLNTVLVFAKNEANQLGTFNLYEQSTTLITQLSLSVADTTASSFTVIVSGESFPSDSQYRPIRLFFRADTQASAQDYSNTILLLPDNEIHWPEGKFADTLPRSFFIEPDSILSGASLYCVAYGDVEFSFNFGDTAGGISVFTSLNPNASPSATVLLPK